MIQGATLDAAFADLQDAGCRVSTIAQIAAYVCLSRVKQLQHICILQPFSPLLFTQGPPAGPDRLVRRLSQQITVEEAQTEWEAEYDTDLADTADTQTNDPTTSKHLCASCYLQGKNCYMLAAYHFGIKKPSDF